MTVFGRDASNFDGIINYAGLGFLTHKVTEGTGTVHDKYGPRLAAAKAAGVPVLGAYHVLRTPGSGGAGSLAAQLAFWVREMDARTPWWRTVPFVLQVDAEKWPYDNVAASTVLAFADQLARSGLPGLKVTYASRGQYGDTLRGIATPLWNANYNGGPNYPGDGWAPGWAPYSGQTPVFLQYTSTGYDHNAFRGNLDQLLALVGGGQHMSTTNGDDMTPEEHEWLRQVWAVLGTAYAKSKAAGDNPVNDIGAQVFDLFKRPTAGTEATLSDEQFTALTARVDAGLAAIGDRLDAKFTKLEQAIGQALGAAATVLESPQG